MSGLSHSACDPVYTQCLGEASPSGQEVDERAPEAGEGQGAMSRRSTEDAQGPGDTLHGTVMAGARHYELVQTLACKAPR